MISTNELIKKSISDYIIYAESVINEYKQVRDLTDNQFITPDQINTALSNFMRVSEVLIDEYEKSKIKMNAEKNDFQLWQDEKYLAVRQRENLKSYPASKWLSKEEIFSYVRVENKDEYLIKKSNLDLLEAKVSKFRQLCESYSRFSNLLKAMADNSRSQMSNLGLENRMNKPIQPAPARRVVR
jgi:hypothetical protein